MPNWVKNIVTLSGDQNEIQKLLESLKTQEQDGSMNLFDFNKIVPMPESLNITSGGNVDLGIDILTYLETGKCSSDLNINNMRFKDSNATNIDELIKYIIDDKRVDLEESKIAMCNLKNYGHKDWYSWRNSNWGTKWNASSTYIENGVIYFETAWSTPLSIYVALSEKFPTIDILIQFADEDLGNNCGEFGVKDGKIKFIKEYDEVQACVLWGYDPYEVFPDLIRDRKIDDLFKK